jgi:hypothetical protein
MLWFSLAIAIIHSPLTLGALSMARSLAERLREWYRGSRALDAVPPARLLAYLGPATGSYLVVDTQPSASTASVRGADPAADDALSGDSTTAVALEPARDPVEDEPGEDRQPRQGGLELGPVEPTEAGRWLLLRAAVREIGSLEHLYRLAKDGVLQSREDSAGRIEVWVRACDRFDHVSPRSPADGNR